MAIALFFNYSSTDFPVFSKTFKFLGLLLFKNLIINILKPVKLP